MCTNKKRCSSHNWTRRTGKRSDAAFRILLSIMLGVFFAFPNTTVLEASAKSGSPSSNGKSSLTVSADKQFGIDNASKTPTTSDEKETTSSDSKHASQSSSSQSKDANSNVSERANSNTKDSVSSSDATDKEVAKDDNVDETIPAVVAEKDAQDKAVHPITLKSSFESASGDHYTVTATFADSSAIPEGSNLSIKKIMTAPKGYDKNSEEWEGRPNDNERFVSKKKLAERTKQLQDALDVDDNSYMFYKEFLNINIVTSSGKNAKVSEPATVVIQTDAIDENASTCLKASFINDIPEGEEHALPLNVSDLSDDTWEGNSRTNNLNDNVKIYEHGIKLSFSTTTFGELGLAGIAEPSLDIDANIASATVFSLPGAEVSAEQMTAEDMALPDGYEPAAAFSISPLSAPEDELPMWLGTKLAEKQSVTVFVSTDNEFSKIEFPSSPPVPIAAGSRVTFASTPAKDDVSNFENVKGEEGIASSDYDVDEVDVPDEDEETGTDMDSQDSDDANTSLTSNSLSFSGPSSNPYRVTVSYTTDAKIPDDTTLFANELSSTQEKIIGKQLGNEVPGELAHMRAFNVKMLDTSGNEVVPAAPVTMTIETPESAPMGSATSVIALADNDAEHVVLDEKKISKDEQGSYSSVVSFKADGGSSVYALAYSLTNTVKLSSGDSYRVSASYDLDSGIPLTGTSLLVREIDDDDSDAVTLDIKLVDSSDENVVYQPAEGTSVSLSVTLIDDNHNLLITPEAEVLHKKEDGTNETIVASLRSSDEGYVFDFETSGFSHFTFEYGSGHDNYFDIATFISRKNGAEQSGYINPATAIMTTSDEWQKWFTFDTLLDRMGYDKNRYTLDFAQDTNSRHTSSGNKVYAFGFWKDSTLIGSHPRQLGIAYNGSILRSATEFNMNLYLVDNSVPVSFQLNGESIGETQYFVHSAGTVSIQDIYNTYADYLTSLSYQPSSYAPEATIGDTPIYSLTCTESPSDLSAHSPWQHAAGTSGLVERVDYDAFGPYSYESTCCEWKYNKNGVPTNVGDTPLVINLVPAIARVSNDGGSTWTSHSYLINNNKKIIDNNVYEGAFDQANSLTGDVIIETLRETAVIGGDDRYTLANGYTFDNSAITSLVLRTTSDTLLNPDSKRSILVKNQTASPMISVTGPGTFTVSELIFDGANNVSTNASGGGIYTTSGSFNLNNCDFRNCQAGYHGGGACHNNSSGSTTVTNCIFTGCRANGSSDNEDTGGGGGFYSNSSSLNATGNTFTDCTTAVRQAAGLFHRPSTPTGAVAMVSDSSFTNCIAAHGAGGFESDAGSVNLSGCTFTNCKGLSGSGNGGAVNVYLTNMAERTSFTVTDCTFSSCSTAGTGGGIRSVSLTNTITRCTFNNCTSNKNGGAIAFTNTNGSAKATVVDSTASGCISSSGSGGAFFSGGELTFQNETQEASITGCSAAKGGAVYTKTFIMTSGSITGNSTGADSAAVHATASKNPSGYTFSGSPVIKDNAGSAGDADIYLCQASDQTINVTGALSATAAIGVYATDTNNIYNNYGLSGKPFAKKSAGITENLNAFFSNRSVMVGGNVTGYGSIGEIATKIYWSSSIARVCQWDASKSLDEQNWEYFDILISNGSQTGAFNYANSLSNDVVIETLRKGKDDSGDDTNGGYTLSSSFEFNGAGITKLTLRTTQDERLNPVIGQGENAKRFTSVITRGWNGNDNDTGALLCLNNAATTFITGSIVFDGGRNADNTSGTTGRAIYMSNGSLGAEGNTTFRNFYSGSGGGVIYAPKALDYTISNTGNVLFDNCTAKNGGAIYAKHAVTIGGNGKTIFTRCMATESGGGIYQDSTENMALTNVTFGESGNEEKGCFATLEGGSVYSKGKNSTLTDCSFYYSKVGYGNAANSVRGGAIFNNGDGEHNILGCVFDRCSTQTTSQTIGYGNGGAIEFYNAAKVTIDKSDKQRSSFTNCYAYRYGGAVMFEKNDNNTVSIKNADFEDCHTEIRDGGAVYSDSNDTSFDSCVFKRCYTNSSGKDNGGGAIYMNGDTPKITSSIAIDNCQFEDCHVPQTGGAIHFHSEKTEATLTNVRITGHKTTDAGTANAVLGAAIYSKGNLTIKTQDMITSTTNPDTGEETSTTTPGVTRITNCSASGSNGGAINLASGKSVSFEGNVVVYGNPSTSTEASSQKNVVLDQNNNTTIRTLSNGLGENAHIGIYVTDGNPYNNHGKLNQDFGTASGTGDSEKNLNKFINDRNPRLFGISDIDMGKESTDNKIYWGHYVCKLTDENDNLLYIDNTVFKPATYITLAQGFTAAASMLYKADGSEYASTRPIKLKMLEDYIVPAAIGYSTVRNLTFTTAETDSAASTLYVDNVDKTKNDTYTFATNRTTDTERAELIRGFTGSMFSFSENAPLSVENLILLSNEATASVNGGAITQTATGANASLNLTNIDFGALKANGTADDSKAFKVGSNYRGGAVYSSINTRINVSSCNFYGATARCGGGVYYDKRNPNGFEVLFEKTNFIDCQASGEYGAAFSGWYNSANPATKKTTVKECKLINCKGTSWSGGMIIRSVNVELIDSTFQKCYSTNGNSGGAVFVSGCTNGTVDITRCAFEDCYATGNGGAVHLEQKANSLTVSGSTFKHCGVDVNNHATVKTGGSGGAIYGNATTMTIQKSVVPATAVTAGTAEGKTAGTDIKPRFENCRAGNNGGAVWHGGTGDFTLTDATFGTLKNSSVDKNRLDLTKNDVDSSMICQTTGGSGGAVYTTTTGVMKTDNCRFYGIKARNYGGGIFMDHGTNYNIAIQLLNSDFIGGTAELHYGSAIVDDENDSFSGSTTIKNSVFADCASADWSSAVLTRSRETLVEDSTFARCNSAGGSYGGAMHIGGATNDANASARLCRTRFEDCSGTGSGGAVALRYHVESAIFEGCEFENCLASGNGGAIYADVAGTIKSLSFSTAASPTQTVSAGTSFSKNDSGNWTQRESSRIDTSFINCKANSNSGGAIYSAAGNVDLNDNAGTIKFENCNAGAYGGAIYYSGNLSMDDNTGTLQFKECTCGGKSDGDGGAICNWTKKAGSFSMQRNKGSIGFENCYSKRTGYAQGGAIFLYGNGNKDASSILISNAPDSVGTIRFDGCHVNANGDTYGGGAISGWTGVTCVMEGNETHPIEFQDCYTEHGHGGAIYNNGELSLTDVNIDGHTSGNTTSLSSEMGNAVMGGALYSNGNLTIRGGRIKNCSASDVNGGAINVSPGKIVSFEGTAVIFDNKSIKDGKLTQANVVLDQDNNTTINTTSAGIGENAHIGIYAVGANNASSIFGKHGKFRQDFGMIGTNTIEGVAEIGDANLDRFTNDRNGLYGEKDTDNAGNLIRWQSYVCKITDENGNLLYTDNACVSPAVYNDVPSAFAVVTGDLWASPQQKYSGDNFQIKMLIPEYDATAAINALGKVVTFTTETETSASTLYPYWGESGTAAVIMRDENELPGSMMVIEPNANLILRLISIDGSGVVATNPGGIIAVNNGGTLVVSNDATLRGGATSSGGAIFNQGHVSMNGGLITGCTAQAGGAVYIMPGASMDYSGGIISGNTAGVNAPGIYIKEGASLALSGTPDFGSGNSIGGSLENGGTVYAEIRQDIYIEGYIGMNENDVPIYANSLVVNGAFSNSVGAGSIWVWAENPSEPNEANHYAQFKQFAVLSDSLIDGNGSPTLSDAELEVIYMALRNACADSETGNATDSWLHGAPGPDEEPDLRYIFWNGTEAPQGWAQVVLRKTNTSFTGLEGARFSVYKSGQDVPYTVVNAETGPDGYVLDSQNLVSDRNGIFWCGKLPYGTYHMHETSVPSGVVQNGTEGWWYTIEIGEEGFSISEQRAER